MTAPYAEVIGDPIAQSKSPLIHRHWLQQLGIPGDYRATRVTAGELPTYLAERRQDPAWRGCNVTIPHKERILPLLERLDAGARDIGAVNCVAPGPNGLTGRNTDIDGVAVALDDTPLEGRSVVLIGAGGGARAALSYFLGRGVATVAIVVRDPGKAAQLERGGPGPRVALHPMNSCRSAFEGAAAIVNASPLGMAGAPPMPHCLLDCIAAHGRGTALLDMVYKPLRTEFLKVGEASGGFPIDGIVMLLGQARAAFRLFFDHSAPPVDSALAELLVT